MSNLTVAYIQRSGKILKILRSTTHITSRLESWSEFNDRMDPMIMGKRPLVVGQTIWLPFRQVTFDRCGML
jgi:hypothetical protein